MMGQGEEKALVHIEPKPLAKTRPDTLRDVEEEIHEEAAAVIQDALRFSELAPEATEPPYEWVKEVGMERAMKRFYTAKYALMNAKEAPIGLRIAKDTLLGMVRAKSKEKAGPKTLNMVVVQMTGSIPVFDEIEIEK